MQLTELCAVSARERVRARVTLGGRLSVRPDPGLTDRSSRLLIRVDSVTVEEGDTHVVPIEEYHAAEPDPLHSGSAEQLQHLAAHHPDAIELLSRLCDREALIGVIRVLPVTLDRYGVVLRVERLRDHRDVRLPFTRRVDTGAEAAAEMRHLLASARRPCGR